MTQIIINKPTKEGSFVPQRNELQPVAMGNCFNTFVDSQRIGYVKSNGLVKSKGLSAEGVVNLKKETCDILSHCNSHNNVDAIETTHLVVGYVQSGKTMSFTALTALAKDNGYRMIIYLAGSKNNLLEQTATRLENDLIKNLPELKNDFKIHSSVTPQNASEVIGHLRLSTKPIILIPILKHYKHISELADLFDNSHIQHHLKEETVLIIDDEADQASLNSLGRKNSKQQLEQDEKFLSSTYASILKLRSKLPGNSYIQYTATPQANILISMNDLLSPRSHTLLTPGEDYIGGKLFFGKGDNHDLYHGALVVDIPKNEVFHKKKNPLKSCPRSLRDALILHILAVAIVVKHLKVEGINYLSMMVHVDNMKYWNKTFKEWIDTILNDWSLYLDKPDGHDDKVDLLKEFSKLFPQAVKFYPTNSSISFDEIKQYIPDIINDKKVYLINSDSDAEKTVDWDRYCMHILVGAEMLNRGFTVEKLATTYMPRYSVSATNADTIQQRCRFFGYKKDYIQSCRVFLPAASIINYLEYVDHEEELRSMLSSCATLEQAERKLMLSPRLKPTRSNVLPISIINSYLKGINAFSSFDPNAITHNNELVSSFLERYKERFDDIKMGGTGPLNSHRGFKLDVGCAIEFLSDFQFKNPIDSMKKAATIRYLRYLSEKKDSPLTFVYFIQMSFKGEDHGELRKRPLDISNGKLGPNTTLLQGRSTKYDGDAQMIGTDSVTIQLHHIEFANNLPISYPRQGYTLAINYPQSLATSYISNQGEEYEEEEDEDE